MRYIRISLVDTPSDYQNSLLPIINRDLGYNIQWTKPNLCDLQINGPFFRSDQKPYRWLPRLIRPFASKIRGALDNELNSRSNIPLRIFHTYENIRHDAVKADYSISFDLSVQKSNHFRLPYWMEMIDWSHEGLYGNVNRRFGQLLKISRMSQPLGDDFFSRPRKAAFFSSHLREPRATLVETVSSIVQLDGFGSSFNKNILDHHQSGIEKFDCLQDYAFNLCPENGLYPGYYTEKIPEAFAAGCLPLAWTDSNVCIDFNPNAFINLEPMTWQNFEQLREIMNSNIRLEAYVDQPLLINIPSIDPLRDFLREILQKALS